MATLQQAIDQIVDAAGAVSGIRFAPDEPNDQTPTFPALLTFCERGTYRHSPIGVMTGSHTILLELHVARRDLARDVAAAMAYAKSIPNAILNAHKTSALTAIEEIGEIGYEFGPMTWAGQDTIGFRFRIQGVKTQDTIA